MPPTPPRPESVALAWFRDDLRLSDHPALAAAAGEPIARLCVLDEASAGSPDRCARSMRRCRTAADGASDAFGDWKLEPTNRDRRVFNPVVQGEKFNPSGAYVRQGIPELAGTPNDFIHQPFAAPPIILADVGVKLGKNYPHPTVHPAPRASVL